MRSHRVLLEVTRKFNTVAGRTTYRSSPSCSLCLAGWPQAWLVPAHTETTKSTRMNGGYTRQPAWRACADLLIAACVLSSSPANRCRAISVRARPISRFIGSSRGVKLTCSRSLSLFSLFIYLSLSLFLSLRARACKTLELTRRRVARKQRYRHDFAADRSRAVTDNYLPH